MELVSYCFFNPCKSGIIPFDTLTENLLVYFCLQFKYKYNFLRQFIPSAFSMPSIKGRALFSLNTNLYLLHKTATHFGYIPALCSNRNEYQEYFLGGGGGVKAAGAYG
jgi:hypothetical protein